MPRNERGGTAERAATVTPCRNGQDNRQETPTRTPTLAQDTDGVPVVDADALAAELDALRAEQQEASRLRRDRRTADRADRQARREHGLAARHAAKLTRGSA